MSIPPRNTENNEVKQPPHFVSGTPTTEGRGCIHHLFEEQVRERADAVAVEYEGYSLTYLELNRRANQLGHALVNLGVRPNDIVGLCVERSLDLIIGILGILKSGAAYLPLDPEYPAERLAFMLTEASAPVLVTQRALSSQISFQNTITLYVDEEVIVNPSSDEFTGSPPIHSCSTDLAYVIYTSGSTGKPKGTQITHHNVVRLFAATDHWFGFTEHDVWTLFHSFAFDFSVWEIWGALLYGGKLIIVPDAMRRSPGDFYRLLADHRITVLNQTPSVFRQLIHAEECGGQLPLSLRFVIFGGEALQIEMLRSWWERHGDETPQVVNMYGITETTVHVTYRPLCRADLGSGSVIGRAIPDLEVHLLDADGKPVADGMAGEMYIAGAGLAKGYLQRPDLTARRFVSDHISGLPNARLYRTGDLARKLPCGDLEYIGRIDQQVKIRGFRIELGEIEFNLERHPNVVSSAVVSETDTRGDQQLVAYLVLRDAVTVSVQNMRGWLGQSLPDYMIPSRFAVLQALPLTPNGKIDRRALATCQAQTLASGTEFCAPQTPLESQLAIAWQKVLRLERVSVEDNFFVLGGHSLLAQTVVANIRSLCRIEVPLIWVFQHPTIRDLAQKLANRPIGESKLDTITLVDRSQPIPMSFGQRRMWILQQTLPTLVAYNVPVAHRVTGPVNPELLQSCMRALAERHEALRTALIQDGDSLRQRIVAPESLALPWREVSWRALTNEACDAALCEEVRRPFDLKQAPLWRALWAESGPDEYLLVLTFHHSIVDEWSLRLFFRELESLYSAGGDAETAGLAALPAQYADYSVWQRQRLTDEVRQRDTAYWAEQLIDPPPPLPLPADSSRPGQDTHQGAVHRFPLPLYVVEDLRRLARTEGASLFTLMLAAYQVWLSRHTNQNDVIVATPVADRDHGDLHGVFGYFLNTVPIRTRLARQASFRETLTQIRQTVMAGIEHSGLPFEEIVALATSSGDSSRTSLHQVMFVLLEEGIGSWQLGRGADARETLEPNQVGVRGARAVNLHNIRTGTSKCDLLLSIAPEGDQWFCELEFATDLFTVDSVQRMATHWVELLRSIVANPGQRIALLNTLPESEKCRVLKMWNNTQKHYPRDRCVHELFEEQAEKTSEAVAVTCNAQILTYRELNQRANRLARFLQQHVDAMKCVGVYIGRSIDFVVTVLAVLKAGGTYVPLAQDIPLERLQYILDDSGTAVLVTNLPLPGNLCAPQITVVDINRDATAIASTSDLPVVCQAKATDPAYVMYTSGSTGRPKGVTIPHRGIVRLVCGQDYVDFKATQRFMLLAPTSFDASTFELWAPLLHGNQCVIFPDSLPDFQLLETTIARHKITCLWLTAGLFNQIIDQRPSVLSSVRQVLTGGEALSTAHVRRALELLPNLRLTNGYGPTECTTFACTYDIDRTATFPNDSVPIGRPIANTHCYVLDDAFQPVPIGVAGELFLGGDGLACGYLNLPDLTTEKFVANPFRHEPEARLYRTGDYVRYNADGLLEFLGRRDQQVKVRGFRIELGEIETTIQRHSAVATCAVIVRAHAGQDKQLIAFLVPVDASQLSVRDLRNWLAEQLPSYMIPAGFHLLDALPLTPNGKVDRQALLQISGQELESAVEYAAPQTDLERQLVDIWQTVLRRTPIGIHDNFFELGGNSLVAVQLVSRMHHTLESLIPVATLFAQPTIATLARAIGDGPLHIAQSNANRTPRDEFDPPLFLVQWHVDFSDHELGRRTHYVLPFPTLAASPDHYRVEFLAAECLKTLKSVQPHGPYHLAGFSLPGLVAYEMARFLREQGEEVALVAVIDTIPSTSRQRKVARGIAGVGRFIHLPFSAQVRCLQYAFTTYGSVKNALHNFAKRPWHSVISALRDIMHVSRRGPSASHSDQHPATDEEVSDFWYLNWAYCRYVPQSISGSVVLVVTEELERNHKSPADHWRPLAERVEAFVVRGNHKTCLREHKSELATTLLQCLTETDRGRREQNTA